MRSLPALALIAAAVVLTGSACSTSSPTDDRGAGPATTVAPSAPAGDGPTSTASAPNTTASTAPGQPPGTVVISDYAFSPREITIRAGQSVTWDNEDEVAHWVVSTQANVLDSQEIGKAQSYSQVFAKPGTYPYYCNIHNYMKGTVVVG